MPAEYRAGLLRRLAKTGLPLDEAVRGLFRGRDFHAELQGMPEDADQIRATLVGLIQTPATRIAGVVQAPAAQLARVLNAYATKNAA